MKKLFLILFLVIISILVVFKCTRITPPEEDYSTYTSELQSISQEYGKLVNITTITAYPNWAQLWFEDADNTIRMVRINWNEKRIHNEVITIPRK